MDHLKIMTPIVVNLRPLADLSAIRNCDRLDGNVSGPADTRIEYKRNDTTEPSCFSVEMR